MGKYTSNVMIPAEVYPLILDCIAVAENDWMGPVNRNDIWRVFLSKHGDKFPLVFITLGLNDLYRNDEVLID